jgi:hypothetical protein
MFNMRRKISANLSGSFEVTLRTKGSCNSAYTGKDEIQGDSRTAGDINQDSLEQIQLWPE